MILICAHCEKPTDFVSMSSLGPCCQRIKGARILARQKRNMLRLERLAVAKALAEQKQTVAA